MRLATLLNRAAGGILLLAGATFFTQVAVAQGRVDSGALLDKYCTKCHNSNDYAGGIDLESANAATIAATPEIGEKLIKRLRAGMMPPVGEERPQYDTVQKLAQSLEQSIDKRAATRGAHLPAPGLHRLNRTEYTNAIRDLLALRIDAARFLPSDDASHGFDNMAGTLTTSPALLEAYLAAAGNISRLAIGTETAPTLAVFDAPHDTSQNEYVEGLPFGTRGGMLIEHEFPADGEYTFTVKGMTGYFTAVLGNVKGEKLEVTVDGKRVHLYDWDKDISTKRGDGGKTPALAVKAGFHRIGVAFLATSDLPDTGLNKSFQRSMNSPGSISGYTFYPHVGQVFIEGPFKGTVATDTQSRRRIFECYPQNASEEASCARQIIMTLTTKAFRRPATDADIKLMTAFYRSGREQGGKFDAGIEAAIQRILTDPDFIYRAEIEPAKAKAGTAYRISDLELASRLSFFLWSSIPDTELIKLASTNKLHTPKVLKQQVDRMIADPRSQALVQNFTGQWLNIRGIAASEPVVNLFPDFDSTLREAFRREVELFFTSIIQEDRSVDDLLTADYTFVNERLARHYGIPGIYGPQFRRVTLGADQDMRRGLLGKGALQTITSDAARTSPVKRGKWFLQTFFGVSPPDPPPGVETKLDQKAGEAPKTMRERLVLHSTNPSCASCHKMFEPMGLAMENFDAVGQWRLTEVGNPINTVGVVTDGTRIDGIKGLRDLAMRKREMFAEVLIEKLLTYAIGRGLDHNDMPLVRALSHTAAKDGYRFSSLIMGVVQSPAFTMNMKPGGAEPMFITKKHISRRALLRGAGTALALPLLDAMIPAFTAEAKTAAKTPPRFFGGFVPHGAAPGYWIPEKVGALPDELPFIWKPMEPFRKHLNILTGLHSRSSEPAPGETGADHWVAAAFLCAQKPRKTAGADVYAGQTIDQIIAARYGQETLLPSVEISVEDPGSGSSNCGEGYSCVYTNTISWAAPNTPLPMELNPQVVFERMFGSGSTAEQRVLRRERNQSILDSVNDKIKGVRNEISAPDRARLDAFTDNVREIERRLQIAASATAAAPEDFAVPTGIPQSFDQHIKIMFDLLVLGFQADITRVGTMLFARDLTGRVYPESASPKLGFHGGSHHGEDPNLINQLSKINQYHVKMLAYFVEKLANTSDGNGSLLDHSLLLYGSNMGNPNQHVHYDVPHILVGGNNDKLKGGRHLAFPTKQVPTGNLLLSILDQFDIPRDSLGDSTGHLAGLT